MNIDKALLVHYRGDPSFRKLLDQVGKKRPVVPQWRPQDTRDANEKLMEDIKYASAQQQGWDLLFAILYGVKE